MTPQHKKISSSVLHSYKKPAIKRWTKRKRHASPLSCAEQAARVLLHCGREASEFLELFQNALNPNPLVVQCAIIASASYSWAPAKAQHITDNTAQEKRLAAIRAPPKPQYETTGPKTRVWVPRWPNENPALLPFKMEVPEDKHAKSREAIVRIVQDQEEATKAMFKYVKCSAVLSIQAKSELMQREFEFALRAQGVEVIEWVAGTSGPKMEVYFQTPESWKGEWGLL